MSTDSVANKSSAKMAFFIASFNKNKALIEELCFSSISPQLTLSQVE